uniref:Uncharacterized protein n=1 Tax=Globodera rostochiensis TaxID=31243 RepID=A0A914HRW0_GLORO
MSLRFVHTHDLALFVLVSIIPRCPASGLPPLFQLERVAHHTDRPKVLHHKLGWGSVRRSRKNGHDDIVQAVLLLGVLSPPSSLLFESDHFDKAKNVEDNIAEDERKRKIIDKFHAIKDEFKQKGKFPVKEWNQIEDKNPKISDLDIAKILKIGSATLIRWKKQFHPNPVEENAAANAQEIGNSNSGNIEWVEGVLSTTIDESAGDDRIGCFEPDVPIKARGIDLLCDYRGKQTMKALGELRTVSHWCAILLFFLLVHNSPITAGLEPTSSTQSVGSSSN